MGLDTLPARTGGQRLGEIPGFREISPYRYNRIEEARFLALDL